MVILITGSSHVGKTLLAQRMLEIFKYPYLSIDHLKMGLIRSGNTDLTPEDDDELTGYLWPIVREIIKTAIENEQNLIVEGCYVPPDWRKDFDDRYLSSVRFICLAMTEDYIQTHFLNHIVLYYYFPMKIPHFYHLYTQNVPILRKLLLFFGFLI